ncbi:Myb-like_DNA-binding domain-containing protein [Hexamita inflata]|uniref:Myb-like DNA-binding domain-containing protein n=1 Tax=Hexamita inflata TaxID=28002 RepID=A0AA86P4D9_9EUKA|nr:Myb-like DNA-binding domain-containing protein [Hexamita inflata]
MPYHKWTVQEEGRLQDAVKQFGLNWQAIHMYIFQSISPACLKNKYYSRIHNNNAFESVQSSSKCNELDSVQESILQQIRIIIQQGEQ